MIRIPLSRQALRKRMPSRLISVARYVNHDGARSIVDLRVDLGEVFDVELADQLDDQGVS